MRGRERNIVMLRTHTAGTLRASDIGTDVTLTGWVGRRRDHGGVAFIDLRDASGVVQVVVRDDRDQYRKIDVQNWIINDESIEGVFGY